MAERFATAAQIALLGFIAVPEFHTEHSIGFALLERHSENFQSLRGWIDIHFPCEGTHQLRIRACLDPDLLQFARIENFGGHPSATTDAVVERIVKDVCNYLGLNSEVTWHVDLQARAAGLFAEDPQTFV